MYALNNPEALYEILEAAQRAKRVCGRNPVVVGRMEEAMKSWLDNEEKNRLKWGIGRPPAKSEAHIWHDGPVEVTQEMVDRVWTEAAVGFRNERALWKAQSDNFYGQLKGQPYIHETLGRYQGWTLNDRPDGEGTLVLARLLPTNERDMCNWDIHLEACSTTWVLSTSDDAQAQP